MIRYAMQHSVPYAVGAGLRTAVNSVEFLASFVRSPTQTPCGLRTRAVIGQDVAAEFRTFKDDVYQIAKDVMSRS